MCIKYRKTKSFSGAKRMKVILYRKTEVVFHQGLGTGTGKTYSKVDRNCCSSEVIQQPKSVKIILWVTITFVPMMPLDHFAALICYWGYTFAKASLSGDSTQSKLTQLLQAHLRHSNQFITDPRAPYPLNTYVRMQSLQRTFLTFSLSGKRYQFMVPLECLILLGQ